MLIFVLVIRMFSKFDLPRQAGSKLKSQLEVKNFISFIYLFFFIFYFFFDCAVATEIC